MRVNLELILLFFLGAFISWLETVYFLFWPWLIFPFLIWRSGLKEEYWWGLFFVLGLTRDLFAGASLGKSAFLFLVLGALFLKAKDHYRKPNLFLQ